jgi:hypothetical protein
VFWKAVNEVTWKCSSKEDGPAIAWAMNIENHGWFGRVRDARGEWSFGPAMLSRCRDAVEARLHHEMFDKREGESSWSGTCAQFLQLG